MESNISTVKYNGGFQSYRHSCRDCTREGTHTVYYAKGQKIHLCLKHYVQVEGDNDPIQKKMLELMVKAEKERKSLGISKNDYYRHGVRHKNGMEDSIEANKHQQVLAREAF